MHNYLIPKLKLTIKNDTDVTLNLSSNAISDSNDETNFPHKLLLTLSLIIFQGFVKLLQIIHHVI